MKAAITLITLYAVIGFSCNSDRASGIGTTKDTTVFFAYDSQGKVLEEWGNTKEWDNNVNFRTFYTYNADGTLKSERYYSFDDDNVHWPR